MHIQPTSAASSIPAGDPADGQLSTLAKGWSLNSQPTSAAALRDPAGGPTDEQLRIFSVALHNRVTDIVFRHIHLRAGDGNYPLAGRLAVSRISLGKEITLRTDPCNTTFSTATAFVAEVRDSCSTVSDLLHTAYAFPKEVAKLVANYMNHPANWAKETLPEHVRQVAKMNTIFDAVSALSTSSEGVSFVRPKELITREYRVVRLRDIIPLDKDSIDFHGLPVYDSSGHCKLMQFSFTHDRAQVSPTLQMIDKEEVTETNYHISDHISNYITGTLEPADWKLYPDPRPYEGCQPLPLMKSSWAGGTLNDRRLFARKLLLEPEKALAEIEAREITSACAAVRDKTIQPEESALTHFFDVPVDIALADELPGVDEAAKIREWIRRIEKVINHLLGNATSTTSQNP